MPKNKIQPVYIGSRESMIAHVNDIVRAKLKAAKLRAELDLEITKLERRYQVEFDELGREIQTKEAGVHAYCQQNRKAEFGEKCKSLDLTLAVVGFENTPPSVEKLRGKDTWDEVAVRMAGLQLEATEGQPAFNGEEYVKYGAPQLDKNAVKADRESIPAEVFDAVGIKITSDEIFFIRPKSEVAEASVREAA